MKRYASAFVLLSMIIAPALAYRPLGTEDAGVAGKGMIQFEGSWDYLRWNDGLAEKNYLFVPIYGVTDRLELSTEITYMYHHNTDGTTASGAGDINLVAKFLLAEEGLKTPAFALKWVGKLDNGDYSAVLGSGDKDWSIFAVASKTAGRAVLHSHVGYTWVGKSKDANLRDIPLFALGIDYGATDLLHLLAEINGNRHPDSSATADPRSLLLGLTYKLSDKYILDAGSRWGFSAASPAWNATFGVSATL